MVLETVAPVKLCLCFLHRPDVFEQNSIVKATIPFFVKLQWLCLVLSI